MLGEPAGCSISLLPGRNLGSLHGNQNSACKMAVLAVATLSRLGTDTQSRAFAK